MTFYMSKDQRHFGLSVHDPFNLYSSYSVSDDCEGERFKLIIEIKGFQRTQRNQRTFKGLKNTFNVTLCFYGKYCMYFQI